ncbi:MAG TPA: hypothetical protein VFZ00_11375 [Solirubrobacter sp.]|nr:hypothetical protein [Solirubrobacter sp.]
MRLAVLVALALLAFAGTASGASGIHPIAPKSGATVPRGETPTFRMRVNGKGAVYVRICRSDRKRAGVICAAEGIGRAIRGDRRIYSYKPKFYDFPQFFANRPGTYYWQATRIACRRTDCRQEGPVVHFRVQ